MVYYLYQGRIQGSRISRIGIFTKINKGFELVFEKISILHIWLTPQSTSDFSGCRLDINTAQKKKFSIKDFFTYCAE